MVCRLPLLSADYGSSEGWIGANVNPNLPPESATFAVLPNLGYYEFIPLKETSDSGLLLSERKPVGITEVNVGEEYEIVYTNFAGLYRSNLLLNIHLDKNTEKDLLASVQAAAKLLAAEKLEVLDFTSHADLLTYPGHYVIFWEIRGEATDETIGPLELRVLTRGTFQKIMDHFIAMGCAVSQFKTPRCVSSSNNKVLQILGDNVVKSYFSTAYD
ncbi:putative indole-3-acetic acid-amido synthetase GH3.5 [Heracleum sosnowskyi]|uniref:Indole-3-acetic acid-amido synthetase GH3.5 n=1 Tax=Heracleum sosnowskyi TaxID=360622 RepID=A0AAD8HBW3_9APIA|nr:putative indole-3-acetic acid-amido synthetase GH3.5 [Heracleum sosnowskyi]